MAVAMLSSGQRKIVSIAAIAFLIILALFSTPPRPPGAEIDHSFLTIWNAGNAQTSLPPSTTTPPPICPIHSRPHPKTHLANLLLRRN